LGHIHLGTLPRSKSWRQVVDLIDARASVDDVAAAAAVAAERELKRAAEDDVYVEAVRLLAAVPQAALQSDFRAALAAAGLDVPARPGLLDLVGALGERLDAESRRRGWGTDFGELTRRALLTTMLRHVGDALPGLLEATPEDVQAAASRLGQPRAFAALARDFFTELTRQSLANWLDRALSAQIGPDAGFPHAGARAAFDAGLEQYCYEATRIVREFSAGWYAKTLQRTGRIGTDEARIFGAVAFKKIGEELRRKHAVDA
jgi:hypothetical protein